MGISVVTSPVGELSLLHPGKSLQKRGSFLFPKLSFLPIQEPLNHRSSLLLLSRMQNASLSRGTSVMMEMFYILLSSAVATSHM